MYCSHCGTSIPGNLNYCKNCGSRVEKNALIVSNSSSKMTMAAAGAIGVFGLIGVFPILRTLLESRLDQPAVLLVLFGYLATVFLMVAMLVGHAWKRSGDIRIHADDSDEYEPPRSFRRPVTARLEAQREPAVSVTEHTTRTLDEISVERR
ncbi:MAG TPA: zinc ribbon domain-containing protein [Pyrinomonadaceae bacterium]|nr:zinc ribbon domain-containing protein [Pyrinomonadaceae bacterium]